MQAIFSHSSFASALTDRSLPAPAAVTSWTSRTPQRRFGVYRNNVSGALAEALAVRYSVVQRLVGEDFFRAMASHYALANLPQSPVLITYGASFPDFIAGFEPAQTLPYLADTARLDSAHWESYHAADAEPLPREAFAALDPGRLAETRLELLPSVRLVASSFPIVSIWQTNTEDEEVKPVDLTRPEDALVSRPEMRVEVRKLPPGAHAFLKALQEGLNLGEAAGQATESSPAFELATNLAGLIAARLVSRIH